MTWEAKTEAAIHAYTAVLMPGKYLRPITDISQQLQSHKPISSYHPTMGMIIAYSINKQLTNTLAMSDSGKNEQIQDRLTIYQSMACKAVQRWSVTIAYYAVIFILITLTTRSDSGGISGLLLGLLKDPAIWGIALMPPVFMMFLRWSAMDLATQLHDLDTKQTPLEQALFGEAESLSGPTNNGKVFELRALFTKVVEGHGSTMREKNVQVSLEIHEDIPRNLAGQSIILESVLSELLGSAVDRSSKGCIYISAKVLEKLRGTLLLRFEVGDTGTGDGISENSLQCCRELLAPVDGQINQQNKNSPGQTVWFTMMMQKEHKHIAAA